MNEQQAPYNWVGAGGWTKFILSRDEVVAENRGKKELTEKQFERAIH